MIINTWKRAITYLFVDSIILNFIKIIEKITDKVVIIYLIENCVLEKFNLYVK